MDRAIATMLQRRDELRGELEMIESALRTYHRYGGRIEGADDLATQTARTATQNSGAVADAPSATSTTAGGTPPALIAEVAIRILDEEQAAISREDLLKKVEGAGVVIASGDKATYLLTVMRRNQRGRYRVDKEGVRSVPAIGAASKEAGGMSPQVDARALGADP